MKFIVGIVLLAGFGIYAGWWNAQQVANAGSAAVNVGSQVAGAVGDTLKSQLATPTPTPKAHK
jgi:hypothetical protein